MSVENNGVENEEVEQKGEVDDGMHYPPGYQKPEVSSEEDDDPKSKSKDKQVEDDSTDKITQGWAEDRAKLEETQEENRRMKIQLAREKGDEEDEELDGMTEDERVDYLVKKKETAKNNDTVAKKEFNKSELRFFRTTNKDFVANEKGILKFQKENGLTLPQSTKLFMSQQEAIKKAKGGKGKAPITNLKSKEKVGVYDRKKHQDKSISDMFRGN